MTVQELEQIIPNGVADSYAWPGGYPIYYLCTDGGVLCPKCVTKEYVQIKESTLARAKDGWALEGRDINYENPQLFCAHCNERIESAYAEEDKTE